MTTLYCGPTDHGLAALFGIQANLGICDIYRFGILVWSQLLHFRPVFHLFHSSQKYILNKILLRIADRQVGLHKTGGIVQGEPVFRRQFVRRKSYHFIEIRQIGTPVGPLARDDRHRVRTDHPNRSIVDPIINGGCPAADRDHITALQLPCDVYIHIRALGYTGIPDRQIGLHKTGGIVQGEPVFRRQLIRRKSHHFIEIRQIGTPVGSLARDDRHRIRTDHPHRSIIDPIINRGDPATNRDHITPLWNSTNTHVDIRTARGRVECCCVILSRLNS